MTTLTAAGASSPPLHLSFDWWVMTRPGTAFARLATLAPESGMRVALRRPCAVALLLACGVSLLATGALTLRIVLPALIYWAYVPLVEALGLLAVAARSRGKRPVASLLDLFFTGHAPASLNLLFITVIGAFLPPASAWSMLTTAGLVTFGVSLAWSGYIDFAFYRLVIGSSRGAALRDLVLQRVLTWTAVLSAFALTGMNPFNLWSEAVAVVQEIAA